MAPANPFVKQSTGLFKPEADWGKWAGPTGRGVVSPGAGVSSKLLCHLPSPQVTAGVAEYLNKKGILVSVGPCGSSLRCQENPFASRDEFLPL